jgi:aldehyde dehydrogenase (NAD+)
LRLVTPFNFPLAIPTWKAFPALLCGNAVILKPAEDVPHTATVLVEILLEAGLPPESSSSCTGPARLPARRWSSTRTWPVVSFTGSTETGASWREFAGGCTSACRSRWAARTRRSSSMTPT